MDFTYIGAAIIGAVLFVLVRRGVDVVTRALALRALVASVILSAALLINWPHVLDWGWGFAMLDMLMIALSTSIGCLLGSPSLLLATFRKQPE